VTLGYDKGEMVALLGGVTNSIKDKAEVLNFNSLNI
jgi:hypothetical protein